MISIRNWDSFQHYKNRNPPWIRLYARLLDDPELYELSDKAARVLPLLWLIASRHSTDGSLPAIKTLAFQLRTDSDMLANLLVELNHWVAFDDSDLLADCVQHAIPEQSRAEAEQIQSRGRTDCDEVETIVAEKNIVRVKKSEPKSAAIWESYKNAYFRRYGTEPLRNQSVNAILCKVVDAIGSESAPHVAEYYLSCSDQWFIKKGHNVQNLLGNIQKLHTEWKTGNRVSTQQAQDMDRQQGAGDVWRSVMDKNAEIEREKNGQ